MDAHENTRADSDTHEGRWMRAAALSDLGEAGRKVVKLDGKQIALFLDGGDVLACNNRCPHEGYPLIEGTLAQDCVLTCNWHNWKFDLKSGRTLVGGDRVRLYPTRVEEGDILIDMAEPTTKSIVRAALDDLVDSFDDHDYSRMAREIARIEKAGGDPLDAVRRTVNETFERFEYGMGHAIAAGADWLQLYARQTDDAARLACATEVVAHLAWDTRREGRYAFPDSLVDYDAGTLVAAIEAEDEAAAVAQIRGAVREELGFDELLQPLSEAALAHYNDFGHSLIYVTKAHEFVRSLGPEVELPVLLMLVRSLVYARREDLISEFRDYGPALAGWQGGKVVPDTEILRYGGVRQVLNAVKQSGADPEALYDALMDAAAWQMLHMDISYSLATSGPVQDNVGWLDFTHALTFGNAVRRVCTQFPHLWPKGLLQIGCFLGRNTGYVDDKLDTAPWAVTDPVEYVLETRDAAIDHAQPEYIVAAHVVKLSSALAEELTARPNVSWACTAAAALNRFLNSPLKRKHVLRVARQSIETVAREG